jgi:hypothetical protein
VACARKIAGEEVSAIARDYNVSDSTISRLQCGGLCD